MSRSVSFVAFDGMTALDMVGVYTALTRLDSLGYTSLSWDIVAQTAVVESEAGLRIQADRVGEPITADIIVVPGGPATRSLMEDTTFLEWLFEADQPEVTATVCTGSLLLGAAGLLADRQATTHPDAMELLEPYCATVRDDRVVVDGDIVTARGVTASIDLGLWFCRQFGGAEAVMAVREQLDYPYGDQ